MTTDSRGGAKEKGWLDTPWHVSATMTLAIVCWSTGYLIFKEALLHFDPLIAAWGRMFFGFCVFCLVFNTWLLRIARRVKARHWGVYLFTAFCEPCLYLLFVSYGMYNTTVAQTAVLTACTPIIVTLLAWLVIKEKPGRYVIPGFVLAVIAIGALNFTAEPSAYAPNPVLGNGLLLIAGVCSAGYLIALRRFSMPYPLMFSAMLQSLIGSLFIMPVIYFTGTPLPAEWPFKPTLLLVLSGLVTTFGVYTLMNICIPKMPLAKLTSFVNMVPVFTIALSMLLMDETLTLLQFVCCLVILLGVWISQRDKSLAPTFFRKKDPEPPRR